MEWQLIGPDNWIFGEKTRGIVRNRKAEVYYNEEWTGREGGWRWMVFNGKPDVGGYAPSRGHAIYYCETELGFISTWEPSFDMKTIKFNFPGHEFEKKGFVDVLENKLITRFTYHVNKTEDADKLLELIATMYDNKTYTGTITIDDYKYEDCFISYVDFGYLDMSNSSKEFDVTFTWRYNSTNHI